MTKATRNELTAAVTERYRSAPGTEKSRILDEFVALTGFHRKHAIRVLAMDAARAGLDVRRGRDRIYDEAVRQALVVLWEASDRVCGKRLKALLPALIEAMERHNHLDLDCLVRDKLLRASAATIDRLLTEARAVGAGTKPRRKGVGSAVRRMVPVRTFADWVDPAPGYLEVDMVEHCGGRKTDGDFVHTLVLTDVASGWTECIAMPVRNQALIVEALHVASRRLPMPMRGIDTDNDSAFMNETVFAHCRDQRLEFTRSRAYKKNDQAWVEQKNGAIVRRMVGYGRYSGLGDTATIGRLYVAARLYVNFFQPSFKLKAKTREGAKVTKTYHPPATPCERLLASDRIDEQVKRCLREELATLDPVQLLRDIRDAQAELADMSRQGAGARPTAEMTNLQAFLDSMRTAWKDGEARPTHRKPPAPERWWRTRPDPFAEVWPTIEGWLRAEPTATAKELLRRVSEQMPHVPQRQAQLRTLQRRVKGWRAEQAKNLILGRLRHPASSVVEIP